MKKILIVGNYNAGNFGDDLLLLALKRHFKDFDGCEFKVMAPGIPRDFALPPAGIKSFFSFNFFKSLRAIKDSDYVVFGGGGLLNPEESYSLFIWGNVILISKFYKKPVIMIGQSFSGYRSKYLSFLLKFVDLISVRETFSVRNLKQYNLNAPVRKCSDLALALDKSAFVSNIHKFEDETFIVLNLRESTMVDNCLTLDVAVNIVDYILKNSSNAVYLIPFDKSDLSILKSLKDYYKDNGRVFLLPHEKSICMSAIASSKAVIAERLHVGISGLICEKPVYVLSYSSKVIGFFKELLSPIFIINLESQDADSFNSSGIEELLLKISNNELNYELKDILELKNKSLANLRLVNEFIECRKD